MTRHMQLLARYAADLSKAKAVADAWWSDLVAADSLDETSPDFRRSELALRWPLGAASHPRVLAVLRRYWLACDALNEAMASAPAADSSPPEPVYTLDFDDAQRPPGPPDIDEDNAVDPHLFVSEWLLDDHEELAIFVSRLTYWPIGLDTQERFT